MKRSQYNMIIANVWFVGVMLLPHNSPTYLYVIALLNALLSGAIGLYWNHLEQKDYEIPTASTDLLRKAKDALDDELKKRGG